MPLTNTAVAAAVRAELARAGVSGRQLGRDLGWSPAFVHRRLLSKGPAPFKIEELARIAEYLGISVSTFVVSGDVPDQRAAEQRAATAG
ncbi:helix-turn-helix transcriptional regulator [uncultured Deinococcus sp.]|uniref:helix-turn-helix domain-containing protein n=1 Tax=uncultured Deinococcus sp. TaxID=158789 RepID=UPI0025F68188|nr:helix-turn-helix transcriptional regulator [uncultured Deinococcus sp.]